MTRHARWRWPGLACTLALAALAVSSCTPGSAPPSPSPVNSSQQAYALRPGSADALLTDCALRRGLMPPPAGLATPPPGQHSWLQGHRVLIASSYQSAAFNEWFQNHSRMVVAGQQLTDWEQQTVSSGKLPAAVCGPGASAYELQTQVFKTPGMINPWPR